MPIPNVGQNYASSREALIAALRQQPYQNPFGPPPAPPLPQAGPVAELPEGRSFVGPRLGLPGRANLALPYGGAGNLPSIIPPPAGLPPGAVARRVAPGPYPGGRETPPFGGATPPAPLPAAAPIAASAAAQLPANIDTDKYARPQYTVAARGSAPPGFNQEKWANPLHQTPKYVVGRILQQFPPRTENVPAAVAEIQKAYPGARQVGNGKVSIPGVGTMDILIGANVGGKRWHAGSAGPKKGGGAAAAEGGGGGGAGQLVPGLQADITGGNTLAEIIKQIQGISGGGSSLTQNRNALINALRG